MYESHVNVRSLIEFILRGGDIDNRKESGGDPDAMQEGIRIHKKIQNMMPATYRSEVTLKESFDFGDITINVEGRADGIWEKEEDGKVCIIIDEIKSVYSNLSYMDKPRELHLAQAKCYAAIYAKEENLTNIDVQITYCDVDSEEIKRFRFSYPSSELRAWFSDVVKEYSKWIRMYSEHVNDRNNSIGNLDFPYEYRPGQKDVAIDVFRAIKRSRNLFIQAPTGVGKTLSVIYPSLKAIGEGLSDKLFYLTAKTVTATVATDTLKLLSSHGLEIKSVQIVAKEKSCANVDFVCNPDACPYADGHYDRINDAVYDIITHENIITRETILTYALKHRVCPYEFSLDVSDWCDVIIGDYNYAFNPRVRLRRYFDAGVTDDYILLIDEAHNLVSRACEMFSANIVKEDILKCQRLTKGMSKSLGSALTSANKHMLELKRECDEDYKLIDNCDELAKSLGRVYAELSKLLEKHRYFDTREEVLEFFFEVKYFCDIHDTAITGYKIYSRLQNDGTFAVKLLCIDPSFNLEQSLITARSCIFFSATLLPMPYYKELLSGNEDDYAIYAETSFSQNQRLLAIASDVSSKYTLRGPRMYAKIADYIRIASAAKPGNYMVFFPSYDFMNSVEAILKADETDSYKLLIQKQSMSEEEREDFLSAFDNPGNKTLIGMCVMGGIFSEGIDLTDEKLIGAIIVGTGLPMINTESEISKQYFDMQNKDGFAYSYRYPGMNKVMQAAGRVIRKETDRGIILLLDDRFSYSEYINLFPKEWSDCSTVNINNVADRISQFWNQH